MRASMGKSPRVRPAGGLDFVKMKSNQALVQVIAAQAGVAVGGQDLKDAAVEFENGKIEGAAAQVINGDFGFLPQFVQTVGQRGGGRLVDDALDGEAGQFAGLFGGVALGVVEIGGHGDDRARDRLAQGGFGVALELFQDFGGDFLRRPRTARQCDVTGPAPSPATGK
jgi:hypothetical protein